MADTVRLRSKRFTDILKLFFANLHKEEHLCFVVMSTQERDTNNEANEKKRQGNSSKP
jgi:hypothetical protein